MAAACPSEDALARFLSGTLDLATESDIKSHVSQCDSCRDLVAHAVQTDAPELFAGKYEIEDHLGSGGMGHVYRARHVALDRTVAIKRLRPELLEEPDAARRFEREARAAAALRSKHVVQILDVDR